MSSTRWFENVRLERVPFLYLELQAYKIISANAAHLLFLLAHRQFIKARAKELKIVADARSALLVVVLEVIVFVERRHCLEIVEVL